MVKSRRIFRCLSLLLVLSLVSTVMISATFAKYTSEYSGQDTALVARWMFMGLAGATDDDSKMTIMDGSETYDLNLFDHEYDIHINQNGPDSKYIIAPGVEGEFLIGGLYLADVDAEIEIKIDPLANNPKVTLEQVEYDLPILFSVQLGVEEGQPVWSNWVPLEDLDEEIVAAIESGPFADFVYGASGNKFKIKAAGPDVTLGDDPFENDDLPKFGCQVKWKWPFEGDANNADAIDTAFGIASAEAGNRLSYGINMTMTATQVAPAIDE